MIEFRVSRWGAASSPHSSPALPVPVRGCLPAFRGRDRGLLLSFRPLVRLVCWLFSLETLAFCFLLHWCLGFAIGFLFFCFPFCSWSFCFCFLGKAYLVFSSYSMAQKNRRFLFLPK